MSLWTSGDGKVHSVHSGQVTYAITAGGGAVVPLARLDEGVRDPLSFLVRFIRPATARTREGAGRLEC